MTTFFRRRVLLSVIFLGLGYLSASAQSVDFDLLISSAMVQDLEFVGDEIYGATASGGILIWDRNDPSAPARWTALDGLSSSRINGLAWTGRYLWAATGAGGLTRITLDPAGPVSRQYANLGGLNALAVRCVVGHVVGETERVYYGLEDGGVGVINDGFAGNIFSAASFTGLVDDRIQDLALDGEDLWVATADGVSLYSEGIFLDRSDGLGDRDVRSLLVLATSIIAGTADGVYILRDGQGSWTALGDLGAGVLDLIRYDGHVWALTEGTASADRLAYYESGLWSFESIPMPHAKTMASSDGIWLGGAVRPVSTNVDAQWPQLAVRDGQDDWRSWTHEDLLFLSVDGVEIQPDGMVWLGSRRAAGWSGWSGEAWTQYAEVASADNDSLGLINFDGPILSCASGADGSLWMTQFQGQGGAVRYRHGIPDCDHLQPANSGLTGWRIVRIVGHPAGPVFFMSDLHGVDVLLDPDRWWDPAAWRYLPQDASGLSGVKVRDAAVARDDLIWFTSDDGGLVLWDTNGVDAGPDDDLTFDDLSDDVWAPAMVSHDDTNYDFRGSKALAVAPDGDLWVGGGGGVVHLSLLGYSDTTLDLEWHNTYREKVEPSEPGLSRVSVNDIDVDRNGDVWACHDAGLNRIRVRGETTTIDAYTNANAIESFALGSILGASTIIGVPEGAMRELSASPDGSTLVAGGDFGAVVVHVGRDASDSQGPLESLVIYPNPFYPDEHLEGLRIGGFDSDVVVGNTSVEGGAFAEIYDLQGQFVARNRNVEAGEPFWTGKNYDGTDVAAGPYLLRVELEGQVVIKTLAVIR